MPVRLGRPLPLIGLLVIGAVTAIAIAGWVIASASNGQGGRPLSVTVINDGGTNVAIQPCARFFCSKFQPVEVAAGASHTWQTSDGDSGVKSFVIEATPGGRILGCVAEHGLNPVAGSAVVRVSDREKCVT